MAEEMDDIAAKPVGPDTLAAQIALGAATAAEAREYLRNQNNIARLQIENLQKQDETKPRICAGGASTTRCGARSSSCWSRSAR